MRRVCKQWKLRKINQNGASVMKKAKSKMTVEKNASQLAKIKKIRVADKKPDVQSISSARCN